MQDSDVVVDLNSFDIVYIYLAHLLAERISSQSNV